MRDMSEVELAWVAGLLEGEGCFYTREFADGHPAFEIRCNMTDEDVIRKLHAVTGTGFVSGPIQKKAVGTGRVPKPQWLWAVGRKDSCEDLARLLLPLMGARRSIKIRQMLALGEASPARTWDHGRYAWETKKCRCDVCREAFNQHHRDYRARRAARDGASWRGKT